MQIPTPSLSKMTRYLKKKSATYDKFLQEDYETIRVKFTEIVTIVVDEDATWKNLGQKPNKAGHKTDRRKSKVKMNLTIMKDIKHFVSELIEERRLLEQDILK